MSSTEDDRQYIRWERRWRGLSESIQSLINEIGGDLTYTLGLPEGETNQEKVVNRQKLLAAVTAHVENKISDSSPEAKDQHFRAQIFIVLNRLWLYTAERVDYFNKGFFKEGEGHNLERAIDLPPQYILSRILFLASRDFSMYQKLYGQRQNDTWRKHLENADVLAKRALQPAVDSGLVKPAQVITYLQKETSVKVIPYASLAIIGLPYASLFNPIDLLAIPHEVGHHVYVNGIYPDKDHGKPRVLSQELARMVAEYPFWLRRWTEEIFADVYGAIIAGPVSALSAQILIEEKSPEERVTDDGQHPVDIVRPLVYQYILKKIYAGNPNTAVIDKVLEKLEARWERQIFGLPKQFRPAIGDPSFNEAQPVGFIRGKDAAKMLEELISKSDEIPQLNALLKKHADGQNIRVGGSNTATVVEKTFDIGNWGDIQEDQLPDREADPRKEPEIMLENFSRMFNRKFNQGVLGALSMTSDAEKEGPVDTKTLIPLDEPYSTHLIYHLEHDKSIQVPVGVWRQLGDDWGEKGPKTIGSGGGSGYP